MKKILILSSLLCVAGLASAQEYGRVISANPITQQIAVPRQVCSQQYVNEPIYNSNPNGAIVGALAGGLIGSAVGGGGRGYHGGYYGGRNNGATIALGAVTGALIGSQVNNGSSYGTRSVQNCYTQNSYENTVTGYNVVYESRGRTYNTQTSYAPGEYIQISQSGYVQPSYSPQPVYTQPNYYVAPPVVYAPPVYISPAPYYRHHGYYGRH